jgi:acetyltransferase
MDVSLPDLGTETLKGLNAALPAHWSHGNPVDILGDAAPERYQQAVSLCLRDPGIDGVLVMLTPQAMTRSLAAAEATIKASESSDKPVLTCWMGQSQVEAARTLFGEHKFAHFDTPEASVEAFLPPPATAATSVAHADARPAPRSEPDGGRGHIEGVLAEARTPLSERKGGGPHGLGVLVVETVEPGTASRSWLCRVDRFSDSDENQLTRHHAQVRCVRRAPQHSNRRRHTHRV